MYTPDSDQIKLSQYANNWLNGNNCITAGVYRKMYLKLYFELYLCM